MAGPMDFSRSWADSFHGHGDHMLCALDGGLWYCDASGDCDDFYNQNMIHLTENHFEEMFEARSIPLIHTKHDINP